MPRLETHLVAATFFRFDRFFFADFLARFFAAFFLAPLRATFFLAAFFFAMFYSFRKRLLERELVRTYYVRFHRVVRCGYCFSFIALLRPDMNDKHCTTCNVLGSFSTNHSGRLGP